jgi:hypothetical protein
VAGGLNQYSIPNQFIIQSYSVQPNEKLLGFSSKSYCGFPFLEMDDGMDECCK